MKYASKPPSPIQRLMQEDFNIYFAPKLTIANYPAKHHPCFGDILDFFNVKLMLAYLLWLPVDSFFTDKQAPNPCIFIRQNDETDWC